MDAATLDLVKAALGIGGTLLGALGGTVIQGRFSRRQVRDQERAAVRSALREERRLAYAAVIDEQAAITDAIGLVILARCRPDWDEAANHRELYQPVTAALAVLSRTSTTVSIIGPERAADLVEEIHQAAVDQADSMRMPGASFQDRTQRYVEAGEVKERALGNFVEVARVVLGDSPGRAELEAR